MTCGRHGLALKRSGSGLLAMVFAFTAPLLFASPRPPARQQPPRDPYPRKSPRQTVLPIERSPHFGAILVTVVVNDRRAVLILDTGSNTTILSPEIAGLNPARLPHAEPPRKGTGFVGDGRWGQATLSIGSNVWKDWRVLVVDTGDLSRAIQRKVDGILGQDILDEFKYVEINLEAKRLTLGSD